VFTVLSTWRMSPGGANPLTAPIWCRCGRPGQLGVEELLVLDTLDDVECAPGDMIVSG
jgi:hypothetical protein